MELERKTIKPGAVRWIRFLGHLICIVVEKDMVTHRVSVENSKSCSNYEFISIRISCGIGRKLGH